MLRIRKIIASALAFAVLAGTAVTTAAIPGGDTPFGITVNAADMVKSGSCGENVTYTLDDDGTLTISGTGAMENYEYGQSPFDYNSDIVKIIIKDSVTRIGSHAFLDCSSLTSITIPDSVTSIGIDAFSYCTSLTSITIPDSVTSIGSGAFSNCSSLTSITIPDSVTSIGSGAFSNCSSLTSITIPDSVTSIGDYAFEYCSSLTSITIPDSVTNIGDSAFEGCTALESITIPDSVTSIGIDAFSYCTSLKSITIPDSVTSIGSGAFNDCSALESITIPDSVTSIEDSAFSDCYALTDITIPDSVTSIGDSAFEGCTALESITIPDSVTSIRDDAFHGCSALESITIPNSVTSIGWCAFYCCASLESITIPDSVTSIGGWAFYCTSLKSITIPNSVTSISEKAFGYDYDYDSEHSVKLPGFTIKGYPGSEAERYAKDNGFEFISLSDHSVLDPNAFRFYYDHKTIVPGDTFTIGADKLGGNYTGTYYPGPGKVEWEISDPSVIELVSSSNDKTSAKFKAKNFGKCNIVLKLNGNKICDDTINVVLANKKITTDYFDNIQKTNVMTTLENGYNSGKNIIYNYTEKDKNLISFATAVKKDLGFGVIGKQLLAKVGFTTSMQEDAADDAVLSLLSDYCSTEEFLNGRISEAKKQQSKFSSLLKIAHACEDEDKIKELTKKSDFPEAKIIKIMDNADKFYGKGLKIVDLACTAVTLAQIDRDTVCHLINAVDCGGGYNSEVRKGLRRLLDRIDNVDEYVIKKYFSDEMSDKFIEIAEELLLKKSLKVPKAIATFFTEVYEMSGGKYADDFLKAYSAMDLVSYTRRALNATSDENDLKTLFSFFKASVQNFLDYCIDLADTKGILFDNGKKFKELKATSELYTRYIDSFCTYDQLIDEAILLSQGQALEEYYNDNFGEDIPEYLANKYDLSARYNLNTGKFEVIKTTNTGAGVSDNEKLNENDYLFVPSSDNYNKVISIADHGFENITNKKGVVLPDTIESIGDYAFNGSTSIESISLNNNLTKIGDHAFLDCSSLNCITIPDNVKTVGNNAFENCGALSYIEVDSDTIGANAFLNCSSLSEVRFNNRNTAIGENAFDGCSVDLIITGCKNSTAESYAKENNIKFEAIPEYVESLAIETPAQKTVYTLGEEIDTAGLTVKATYTDGTSEIISDGFVIAYDASTVGNKKVFVMYGEKSVSYDITVAKGVPSEISFENNVEMLFGTGRQLHAEIKTNTGYAPQIIYTSSDPEIAEVSMTGYVSALKPGKVQITAKTVGEEASAICEITVSDKTKLNEENYIIFAPQNDNYYLFTLSTDDKDADITIYDENNLEVEKESTDDQIWTALLENGIVYTIKINGATGTNDYIQINEYAPSTEVQIVDDKGNSLSGLTLKVGETVRLKAESVTKNSIEESYYWESDDKSVASIDEEGTIICKTVGSTKIRVKTSHFAEQEIVLNVVSATITGDVNGDGSADIADALLVARADAGLATLSDDQKKAADVNGDGSADIADALFIARVDAGLAKL